jgi:hypothetical protein
MLRFEKMLRGEKVHILKNTYFERIFRFKKYSNLKMFRFFKNKIINNKENKEK